MTGQSLTVLANFLVSETQSLLQSAKTEEELRIGFEKILTPIIKKLGVKISSTYERSIFNAGRPDAVHGRVIIEYERPFSFRSQKTVNHAYQQLVFYIQQLSQSEKESLFLFESKFIGVGFDGEQIFLVQYKGEKKKPKSEFEEKDFILIGPFLFNEESGKTFLTHLRALSRIPLTAENLADRFGSEKEIAKNVIGAFCRGLKNWGNPKVNTFFNEWKRLFGIVYGESLINQEQKTELEILKDQYQLSEDFRFQEILFSLHTYFAFLMKLIVAEILNLKEMPFFSSLSLELTHLSDDDLKKRLEDLEDGGVYKNKGVINFLEGDFFRWYLEVFDSPEIKDVLREMARTLAEFEPATNILGADVTRDLLKKLYQYLVPREIRHRLGEYYTPDWLAEFLINETGYDGNNFKRFLDPACGSGTFLVLAIQKAKEWGRKNKRPLLEIGKSIKENIWGFDLNPLAVIASRTNYLLAMGDLVDEILRKGGEIEIPVYLADSVLWPQKIGIEQTNWIRGSYGDSYSFPTSVGKFYLPSPWIQEENLLISKIAEELESAVRNDYSSDEALSLLEKRGLVQEKDKDLAKNFYQQICDLHKKGKDGIWIKFLKNLSMPLRAKKEKFDLVIGNPPWIRWDYLSREYRSATLQLWKHYGLFSLKGFQARLGGGKKDFSMLFVYASSDYYLKDGGKLGFLITQEVFKSKGAGEGFRRFQLGESKYLKVLKAHDLVSIQPFEGATNKTAAIILEKGKKTEYPLPYFVWTKKKGVGKIVSDKLLNEVLPLLQKKKYNAKPIGPSIDAWQTYSIDAKDLSKIQGKNYYTAHSGAYISPYGVFWLKIRQVLSNGHLLIENLIEKGKTKIPKVVETIERNLVYPGLRGSDIQRWQATPEIYVLLTQDPAKREPYFENQMKKEWPRTYGYLTKFKNVLLSRASRALQDLAQKTSFYAVFGVAKYTMSNYKVVWRRMTSDLISAVISQVKTPFGYRTIIPFETTALIATASESEAHYLCAIINSTPVRDFIKSFSSAGRGFGTPSVMEHVGIPKFNPKNPLHQRLSEISKKCHQLKAEGKEKEIEKLEKENDQLVKRLFGINYEKK